MIGINLNGRVPLGLTQSSSPTSESIKDLNQVPLGLNNPQNNFKVAIRVRPPVSREK